MIEKLIKKAYGYYRDYSKLLDITSGFLLILAFVIVLPTMAEFQFAWLGAFITFAVAIQMIFRRLEIEKPYLKLEGDFKIINNNLKNKIEILESRINRIKKEMRRIKT